MLVDVYDVTAIAALIAIAAIILIGGWMLVEMPGKLAADRHHPNAAAIRVCGWMGLLTFGLFWAAAMVWATRAIPVSSRDNPQ